MVEWQGGDPRVVDEPEIILPIAREIVEFRAWKSGYVYAIDAEKVGIASNYLGAGRRTKEDIIDHSVGIEILKKVGDKVSEGETIALLYVSPRSDVAEAIKLLRESYKLHESCPEPEPLIFGVVQ